jgi:hypothetical protein
MGGGGKGGGQTTEIPDWLRDPTIRNLERAETVQQMEYQPWTGLDVAAQTPMQQLANQQAVGAAQAFGMAPAGFDPNAGMPQATTQGGISGYSSFPMFEQARLEAEARDPRTAQIRDVLYNSPISARSYGDVDVASLGGVNYVDQLNGGGAATNAQSQGSNVNALQNQYQDQQNYQRMVNQYTSEEGDTDWDAVNRAYKRKYG